MNTVDGKAKKGGRLTLSLGPILFSIGGYVGNAIIKNVPGSVWQTDDLAKDGELTVSLILPDGCIIWPMQRVWKRFLNGAEYSVYIFGHQITKDWIKEETDISYWEEIKEKRPWWKIGK